MPIEFKPPFDFPVDVAADFLDKGLRPRAEEIAVITDTGAIAVMMFRPVWLTYPYASRLGWKAEGPVFPMSDSGREWLLSATVGDDPVAYRWLTGSGPGRLFALLSVHGPLLLNRRDDEWTIEPGSAFPKRPSA